MIKVMRTIMFCVVLIEIMTFSVRASVFTINDLEENWDVHELTSGDSPQYIGWMYGTFSIDISGNLSFISITRSNGDSTLPSGSEIAISPSGIVTMPDADPDDFHGIMTWRTILIRKYFTMSTKQKGCKQICAALNLI